MIKNFKFSYNLILLVVPILFFKFLYNLDINLLKIYFIIFSILLLIMTLKRSLLLITSFIVLIPQSLWYVHESNSIPTLYEIEIFNIKPIELFIYTLLFKILFLRIYSFKHSKQHLFKSSKKFITLFLSLIFYGICLGMLKGNSKYDIFLFAEFRTLLLGLVLLYVFSFILDNNVKNLVKYFKYLFGLVIIKISFIFPEYFFGYDYCILWPITAQNYLGGLTSFFGSDQDIYVILYPLLVVAAAVIVNKKITKFNNFYILISIIVIILSLRRGPLIGLSVLSFYYLIKLSSKNKLISIFIIPLTLIQLFFLTSIFSSQSNSLFVSSYFDRLLGNDKKVQISNLGHITDILDAVNVIEKAPILGHGLGKRFSLQRMFMQNKDESIIVHSSILQLHAKYGIFGSIMYIYFLVYYILIAIKFNVKEFEYLYLVKAGGLFLVSIFFWELFTPPFMQGFRKTFFVMLSILSIDIAINHYYIKNFKESQIDS